MSASTIPLRISLLPLGLALSAFMAVTYALCVLYGLALTDGVVHSTLLPMLLPGFAWLDWSSFFIGLLWSYAYGWYIAIVFVPLYNFFAKAV
jgi:hypothetical protein